MARSDVRLATPGDADALSRLIVSFRDFLGAPLPSDATIRASLDRAMSDGGTEFCLAVGDSPEDLVGYAQLRVFPSVWTTGLEAYIEDIYVLERARGHGVGADLLKGVLERARLRGATAISLTTNERNERAVAFYQANGFEPASEPRWGDGREVRFERHVGDD